MVYILYIIYIIHVKFILYIRSIHYTYDILYIYLKHISWIASSTVFRANVIKIGNSYLYNVGSNTVLVAIYGTLKTYNICIILYSIYTIIYYIQFISFWNFVNIIAVMSQNKIDQFGFRRLFLWHFAYCKHCSCGLADLQLQ